MVQISRAQLIMMLIWTVMGSGVVTVPEAIAQFTVQDGWIAALMMWLGGLLAAFVAWAFVRAFPGASLTEAMRLAFGPWVGTVMALWFSAAVFITLAKIGREFSSFITATALPHTPEYVVDLLMYCCVAFLVYQGVEVVARVNEVITPMAVVVTPLISVLSLKFFDAGQFLPVLADGFTPVWRAAVVPIFAYGLELALALQFVPALKSPRTLPWDILIASAIATALLTISVVVTVGVLGPAASYLSYPVLEVVRSIRMGQFIERLDTLYVMGVVVILVLKLAVFHASLCQGLKDACRTDGTRWACWITALAAWSASLFLFRNAADVTHFVIDVLPGFALFHGGVLPLVAVGAQSVRSLVRPAAHRS